MEIIKFVFKNVYCLIKKKIIVGYGYWKYSVKFKNIFLNEFY